MTSRAAIYVPLSAQYFADERICDAGEPAELLYIRGLAFCAGILGDGHLTRSQVIRFPGAGMADVEERIDALVRTGLWIPDKKGGFYIRSWQKWNRPKAEIEARRERDAARKRAEREGSPGVSQPGHPNGLRKESERSPNGVRKESDPPATTTDGPSGHYVSRGDRTGAGAGVHAHAREAAGAAAQGPPRPGPDEPDRASPRYEPPTPETAAEIAAVLGRAANRRTARRTAGGGAP
jgi:hypothetical protein